MDILTDEQKKAYLDSGGTICPFCGSENISGGEFEPSGIDVIIRAIRCGHCSEFWDEIYELVGVEADRT